MEEQKKYLVIAVFALVSLVFIGKLMALQLFNDDLKQLADDQVYKEVVKYPARGLIKDRNGELVVYNDNLYDINVIPNQVDSFDTAFLCELLRVDQDIFVERLNKARKDRSYLSSTILKQVDPKDYAAFTEFAHRFSGFYGTVRTIRRYPHKSAALVLGNIGEVNQEEIDASDGYYLLGDYIGKNGLEKSYEILLRGKRGSEFVVVDRFNREVGKLADGAMDSAAVAGKDLITTLDIELQQYAESFLANKRGSIVAIEPSTGEVLCMASGPTYDPNLLVGRERGANYNTLLKDKNKPLFNRPLMGVYPPGSTFKPIMALFALEDGTITPEYSYPCKGGGYKIGRLTVGCHDHKYPTDINKAIQYSCNAYFCQLFRKLDRCR